MAAWRYDLRLSRSGGTVLTEWVEDRRGWLVRAMSPLVTGSRDRGRRNDETMRATLQRLKAVAEQV